MEKMNPLWMPPAYLLGLVAPCTRVQIANSIKGGLLRENTPDQMFQIANIALIEPGESGPRIGVAGT